MNRSRRWLVLGGASIIAATGIAAPTTAAASGADSGIRLPAHLFTP
jgi:hypothetical protein